VCPAGAACEDYSGALYNHGMNDQDNAVITVSVVGGLVALFVAGAIVMRVRYARGPKSQASGARRFE
jgi:hypothetical protein